MWRKQVLCRERKQGLHKDGQGGLLEKVTSEQKPEWRQRIRKDKGSATGTS